MISDGGGDRVDEGSVRGLMTDGGAREWWCPKVVVPENGGAQELHGARKWPR